MSDPVSRFLSENDISDDDALRSLLTQLERDATSVRPMPSPALATLLARPSRPSAIGRHRGAITALLVVGTLGIGVTAAAASPDVRAAAQHVFQTVTGTVPPATKPAVDSGNHGMQTVKRAPTPKNPVFPTPSQVSDHPVPSDPPAKSSESSSGKNNVAPNPVSAHQPTPSNENIPVPGQASTALKP